MNQGALGAPGFQTTSGKWFGNLWPPDLLQTLDHLHPGTSLVCLLQWAWFLDHCIQVWTDQILILVCSYHLILHQQSNSQGLWPIQLCYTYRLSLTPHFSCDSFLYGIKSLKGAHTIIKDVTIGLRFSIPFTSKVSHSLDRRNCHKFSAQVAVFLHSQIRLSISWNVEIFCDLGFIPLYRL